MKRRSKRDNVEDELTGSSESIWESGGKAREPSQSSWESGGKKRSSWESGGKRWSSWESRLRRSLNDQGSLMKNLDSVQDPLYSDQWYLNHGARGGFDMNVQGAWRLGATGKGVVVTILDDGIQTDHPDLQLNYVRLIIC